MAQQDILSTATGTLSGGGSVGGTILTVIGWLFWGLLLGIIVYYAWKYLRHKYVAKIFERTGSGWELVTDRMREERDKDNKSIKTYKLLKNKDDWQGEIPSKYFISKKGLIGTRKEVNFARQQDGSLAPIIIEEDFMEGISFKAVDAANMKWAVIKTKEMQNRFSKKSFFDKYGSTLIGAASLIIIMVVLVVIVREITSFSEVVSSGLNQVSRNLQLVIESSGEQAITATNSTSAVGGVQ